MIRFLVSTVLIFYFLIASSAADPLPSYMKPCSKSAPDLNECIVKNGNDIVPHLVKGDKKYRIPILAPLKLDHIILDPSNTFHLGLKNVLVKGLETGRLTEAKADLVDGNKLQLSIYIPKLIIKSDYEAKGRVLVLPVEGSGPSTLMLEGGKFVYDISFDYYEKHGKIHGKIKDRNVVYDLDRMTFNFDRLFNNNRELSETTNRFLNENWRELGNELRPAISKTISTIADAIIMNVMDKVPFDEIFLP